MNKIRNKKSNSKEKSNHLTQRLKSVLSFSISESFSECAHHFMWLLTLQNVEKKKTAKLLCLLYN